jgi:raffinose/stachyose/melibiose transport system permease protein
MPRRTEPERAAAPRDERRRIAVGWPRRRRGLRQAPWLLGVPAFLLLLAFHLAPVIAGGWYAFTDWNGATAGAHFIGLDNFRAIFKSSDTRTALWNSLKMAGCFVVLANAFGLALALGLNRLLKTRYILRVVFFVPILLSPLAVGFIWQYVFDFNGGLNTFLKTVGLTSWERPWLGDPNWAIWTVLVVLVWQFTGLTMVIYLAGLQGIPEELYEASSIDGASERRQLRRITLPLLAPAITVSATLTVIFGLRLFDQVLALTNGGPVGASETLATQVYKQTFVFGRFGYGAALALILAALVATMVFTQMIILRRREAQI